MAVNKTITSADAVFMLAITGLFPSPIQLHGFSADDVFDTEVVDPVELMMGVDGHLAAGFVFVPVKQSVTLMADSDSNDLFEQWYANQQTSIGLFKAQGHVIQPSLGKAYTMNNGFLSSYPNMADAKKVLQPRKYGITWESVSPADT
jgi:hypothetical protein